MPELNKTPVYSILVPAALLAAQLFVFLPLDIIFRNPEEITSPIGPIAMGSIKIFLVALLALTVPYLVIGHRLRNTYRAAIAVLAILVWINSTFLFGSYGQLDGRGLKFNLSSTLSYLQLAIAALLVTAVFLSRKVRDSLDKAASIILAITLLTFLVNAWSFIDNRSDQLVTEPEEDKESTFHNELLAFSKDKNIIHIILDEMPSSIMAAILEDSSSYRKLFDGFYFFENTASVYPTTIMSIPSLLSGKVYKNEIDKNQYFDSVFKENAFFDALSEQNYRQDFHTIGVYCGGERLQNCTSASSIPVDDLLFELLDIALFKAVPDILKPAVYNNEDWFFRNNFSAERYQSFPGGRGWLLFNEFINDINAEAPQPTYKLFHSQITHSPMRLDSNCDVRPTRDPYNPDSRKEQGNCALQQLEKLFQRMKLLGVYDNSLVIVSSDHGSVYVDRKIAEQFVHRGIIPTHYALSKALLMIKPAYSSGELVITERPASLQDIPNSILGQIEAAAIEDGVDVFTLEENEYRERHFIFYNWRHEYWKKPTLPPIRIYTINGPIDQPTSWSNYFSGEEDEVVFDRDLRCGEPLLFNAELDQGLARVHGLSWVEDWGRWSEASNLLIEFLFPTAPCQSQRLHIKARGSVYEARPLVEARVVLNDQHLGTMNFDYDTDDRSDITREFEFSTGGALNVDGVNVLRIEIDGVSSPAMLGINEDARLMGIGMVEILFD